MDTRNQLLEKIVQFILEIGLPVTFDAVPTDKEFLPGICISNGGLIVDKAALLYPGDILHEAGHLAVVTSAERSSVDGILETDTDKSAGEEMMAIAWSYAAAVHLGIDPLIVFHENGYKGSGATIAKNFSDGRYFGLPMLQWVGLTLDDKNALEKKQKPYPNMIAWVRP
jgi:hypothetical protein